MSTENQGITDQFIKFEAENDLFSLKIQGVQIWPYIRFTIYNDINCEVFNLGQAHSSLSDSGIFKRLWIKVSQLKDMIFKNPLLFLKQKDIIVFNSSRRVKNGEYYECVYTDELLNHLPYSYYVFETPYLGGHYKPVKTKNIRYLDFIYANSFVLSRLYRILNIYTLTRHEKDLIQNLVILLNNEFNVNLDAAYYTESLQSLVRSYYLNGSKLKYILKKVKPKAFIQVCSYSFKNMLMNELAEKYGVKSIELQHGTMGSSHVAYNFYYQVSISTFPDYLLLFGDFWKDTTRFPIGNERLFITGFPHFENRVYLFNNSSDTVYHGKKVILFVSQGPIGKDLSKLAVNLMEYVDHSKYHIVYKLHPGEYERWQIKYPWLKKARGIEVVDRNCSDIYYLFSKAYCQVGVYSTALVEGLGFNLQTYIVKLPGWENLKDLLTNNDVLLVNSAEDLASKLILAEKNNNDNRDKCSHYWKENSLNNMLTAINNILNGENYI